MDLLLAIANSQSKRSKNHGGAALVFLDVLVHRHKVPSSNTQGRNSIPESGDGGRW